MGGRRWVALLLVVALTAAAGCGSGDDDDDGGGPGPPTTAEPAPERGADVASPTVTGPVTGGRYGVPFNPMPPRLGETYDYVEEEYFLAGTASAYAADGAWKLDGTWAARPDGTAPYTTRIVVRRPADPDAFNGAVLVEWHNVTAGMDTDPDFGFAHDLLMRDGWAYVGVSAQRVGIAGGDNLIIEIPGFVAQPLQEWDPERYGSLAHPGDAYSYDIFSQVAQALRRPGAVDVLDGLRPTTVLAAGESQSASRMATYVNAVHPLADIYDGFLVHSRGNSSAPLTDADGGDPVPPIVNIRTDLDDPVLQFETETDLFQLGFVAARQDDADHLRTWEVAGTSHVDTATLTYGVESGRVWNTADDPDFAGACGRLNEGQQAEVLRRALSDLLAWATTGPAPAASPRIEVIPDDTTFVRDAHGNALGGIRTPALEVPTAVLTGERPGENNVFCSLFGRTTTFEPDVLASLYADHDDYVGKVRSAADAAVDAGFLLEEDAGTIVAAAEAAEVP